MKISKAFKNSWSTLEEIRSEESGKSGYEERMVSCLKDLYNLWPEDLSAEDIADAIENSIPGCKHVTSLEVQHIRHLTQLDEDQLMELLENHRELNFIFKLALLPTTAREKFMELISRSPFSLPLLIQQASTFFLRLNAEERVNSQYPWIAKIQSVDRELWVELADESLNWPGVKKNDSERLKKFKQVRNRKHEEWEWIKDFMIYNIDRGMLKDSSGNILSHHQLIIDTWKDID